MLKPPNIKVQENFNTSMICVSPFEIKRLELQGSVEFSFLVCFPVGANLICNETTGPADKKRPRIEMKMVSFLLCCLYLENKNEN